MFEPNAVAAAEAKKKAAERQAQKDRMEAESKPKAERQFTASANMMTDMSKQLSDNPRLARLMELANQKSCKIQ